MKWTTGILTAVTFGLGATFFAPQEALAKLMTFRSQTIIVNMDTKEIDDIHIDEKGKHRVVMCLNRAHANRLSALTYQTGGSLVQIGLAGREIARPIARAAGTGKCFLIPFGSTESASAFEERVARLIRPTEADEAASATPVVESVETPGSPTTATE